MYEFTCPGPVTVDLRVGAGNTEIISEERDTATVEVVPMDPAGGTPPDADAARVELQGDRLIIATPDNGFWPWRRSPRLRITARVPLDSRLVLRSASADLTARGRFEMARINTASGDLYLEHVTGVAGINTASGNVRADRIDGTFEVRGASTDVRVGYVGGPASVHAASGDVELDRAGGPVRVNTASGDIRIGEAQRGEIRLKSASGDVNVGVVSGTGVWLDLHSHSGNTRSNLTMTDGPNGPGGPDLSIHVRTMSGDIEVRRVGPQQTGQPAAA